MNFEECLESSPLIAILRGITPAEIPGVCDALFENGVMLLEIPLNTPDALLCIAEAVRYAGTRQLIGAGTVLSPEDVLRVRDAGGKFIISPNTDPAVIRKTKELGLVSIPGFFTPTEAFAAIAAGADYLKLFPAGCMGVNYVRDLQAVIKKPILAVAGINEKNLKEFLSVCPGAGICGAFYKPGRSAEEVSECARRLMDIVRL